jgi:hypothetical protein
MELDTLKETWNHRVLAEPVITDKEILRIARSGSKTPVAVMKRNLRMEFFTVVALYTFSILYYLIATAITWVAVFLSILAVVYIFYYTKKMRVLNQMTGYTNTIRFNLEAQVQLLTQYMKWYGWIAAILTPLVFIIVLLAWYGENILTSWYLPGNKRFYLLFAAVGIGFSIVSFVVNKWYVYHLYGKHLEELKGMLSQLSEEEGRRSTDDGL